MDEELNEHDLEERLYAMLHHVDETAGNITTNQNNGSHIGENAPRSTVRRYWRTSEPTTQYQKTNTPKNLAPAITKQTDVNQTNQSTKPKEVKRESPVAPPTLDLSIFQSPVPQNIKKTIEIIEHDVTAKVILESSDEDEVIEIALPPKPTITIESSDEDDLHIVNPDSLSNNQTKAITENKTPVGERDMLSSPVPSVVSSVSDDFIRGDCIALNISSRRPDNPGFDFSLHGSDLLIQSTPSKKKKKKKAKDKITSTPLASPLEKSNDECFATPKSKAKNKKQKNSLYAVTAKSLPSADVYDSDSNQSTDTNKNLNYKVTETSLPSADVYESDSNLSEIRDIPKQNKNIDVDSSDSSISPNKQTKDKLPPSKTDSTRMGNMFEAPLIDLTENDTFINVDDLDESNIQESIVMGNVSGFPEVEDYGDENISKNDISQFGSTKIPSILNEDLDFDNLKGKEKVCKRRRYSLTTLRAEMEKFYNESWGGENFNHREIQKSMSRDKNLWVIDPKDRMPSLSKKKVTCNYCNRPGHRDDSCRMKPPVCYMCGSTGHYEPRCPRKICVNCGSPNQMYSSMCRHCREWAALTCAECGQRGHPRSHCPDLWRRYHNTIDNNIQLEKCNQMKKHYQLFCSGCTRQGHLIHTCRVTLPFSGLPINSPYVYFYRPIYPPTTPDPAANYINKTFPQDIFMSSAPAIRNKRQSKSPTAHETHVNKKRTASTCEVNEMRHNTKSTVNATPQRKTSVSKDNVEEHKKDQSKSTSVDVVKSQANVPEKALNFIPIFSKNHDEKGNIIQDNEVSDTSDVVSSARIYVPNDVIDKLNTEEGVKWLKETTSLHSVILENEKISTFLSIKGKFGDQEAFQSKLRDWVKPDTDKENVTSNKEACLQEPNNERCELSAIPKKRVNILRQLNKALGSLKGDFGDPTAIYKELTYLQKRHQQLIKQKVVSPQQLSNNRSNINQMLKKLNMVLLGQAGLANGSRHLNELYTYQEKLLNSRQNTISNEMRKEIAQHYVSIFTAAQRDDYSDLLKKYHTSKQTPLLKKNKTFKPNPKMNRLKTIAISIPTEQINGGNKEISLNDEENIASKQNTHKMTQKLVFYHKKLLNSRPAGAGLKKTRLELVRKMHSFIASLFRKEKMSSKALKKMRKTQEQAQLFLANV